MTSHNDPWGREGPTTLRQRFVAETEQLIDRKVKRVEQLLEDAEREELDINEAREMLRLLKAGSLNGNAPDEVREAVKQRLHAKREAQHQDPPGEHVTPVKASELKTPRSYLKLADALKLIDERFGDREFTTGEFTQAAGLKTQPGASSKLRLLVEDGTLEQVSRGQGRAQSIWRRPAEAPG